MIQATTPAAPIAWGTLRQYLERDQQLSEALLALLESERTCLEQRDYSAFEELLQRKSALLGELAGNGQQRLQWQQSVGLPDDCAALAAAEAAEPSLAEFWRQLATVWETCQQRTRVNEQIAQRTRVVVGRMLDILSGNAGQGSTYDAGGTTHRLQTGRNITTV